MSNLISIIMPVYNAESSLKRSVDSVLNQSYKNIELIIVNDGSKDSSESICLEYQKADSRIKYIFQENNGVSTARNNGLKSAKGEYITFLDADDYLDFDFCRKMLECLTVYKSDLCICMNNFLYQYLKADGSIEEKINNPKLKIRKSFSIKSEDYDFYDRHSHWTVWGALFKKKLLEGLEFKKGLYVGEDTVFLAEVIKKAKKIAYLDEYLLYYIVAINSASHGVFDERKYMELESWKRIIALYGDRPEQVKNVKATYGKRCLKMIKTYYYESEKFRKEYYSKVTSEYRKNIGYVLRADIKSLQVDFLIKHIMAFAIPRIALRFVKK